MIDFSHCSDEEIIASCLIALVDIPCEKVVERAFFYAALARVYGKTGKLNEAIGAILHALELDAQQEEYWTDFAHVIKHAEFSLPNEKVRACLLEGFKKPTVHPQDLMTAGLSLLKLQPAYAAQETQLLSDPLLVELLRQTLIPDADFERWMTHLRRSQLLEGLTLPPLFLEALQQQCVLNEYIFIETPAESKRVEELTALCPCIADAQQRLVKCYRPLRSSCEIESEKERALQIPMLKPITDDISKRVQLQYEENPYPRWISIPRRTPKLLKEYVHELFPWQTIACAQHPDILIAGCGTGQHAISAALKYADSQVLGIDLSLKSLLYASDKAHDMHLSNIHFIQGDLLDLPMLGRHFDLIECAGVLHHMRDPLKGWQALIDALHPQGLLVVSLYSEIARQDVVAARALIEREKFPPSLSGIRRCRQRLLADPAFKTLTQSIDFYTASACRDLLFHVQEHRFTLPQIEQALQDLNMELLGLELPDPMVLKKFQALFPEDPHALSLKNWHLFEQMHPQTFIGMYHLWLRKAHARR